MAARASRSRAFFLELVLDLVVFALCAIVAMQVFVEARSTSAQSSALSHLSIEAQVIAETFKANDGDSDATIAALQQRVNVTRINSAADTFVCFFDASFNSVADEANARYSIYCTIDARQALKMASIKVYDQNNNEVFSIEARCYTFGETERKVP